MCFQYHTYVAIFLMIENYLMNLVFFKKCDLGTFLLFGRETQKIRNIHLTRYDIKEKGNTCIYHVTECMNDIFVIEVIKVAKKCSCFHFYLVLLIQTSLN